VSAGRVVLVLGDDVSTDAIYPGRFMATVLPTETPQYAFADHPGFAALLRSGGAPPGSVVVAGKNFGCGSSREHAVWALQQFGVRCVIAESFGEIFEANCFKNGLLPVALEPSAMVRVLGWASRGVPVIVDLPAQTVTGEGDEALRFAIDPGRKRKLIEGLDDIGMTLQLEGAIAAFERGRFTS
jgi:3-isopropylmalate/(R)-2-methylmalate dehydratase small subunit